jgi:rod shape determining protein RodA
VAERGLMDVALPARLTATDRAAPRHVDGTLAIAAVALTGLGLLMVYSATNRSLAEFGRDPGYYLKRQAVFMILGAVALVAATVIDYRLAKAYAPVFYLFTVILLLLVRTPLGSSSRGAQRWFQIAGFQLSPSLFTRLSLGMMLAAYLSEIKGETTLRQMIRGVAIAAVPMFLVFVQPDMGSTIILAAIMVALLVVSGAKAKYLVVLALAAAVGIFGAFQLHIVKDYQIQRLASFLDPKADAQRAGYNKEQAEIAIGAGGLTGRGFLKGTQTNLDFVPAQHTDFIFTVVGEELGFLGAVILLLLYAVVLWRAFRIALLAKDPFGTYLAVAVGTMIAIQVFVNIGMTIGIMPITGIPLPLISYGGSGLVADLIGIGLLINIHMRRFR